MSTEKRWFERTAVRVAVGMSVSMAMLIAAGCSSAGGAGAADSLAEMDPVTFTYTHPSPEGSILAMPYKDFASEVDEATDGKITFEPYWSSSLLPIAEVPGGLTGGVADVALVYPPFYPEEYQVGAWVDEFFRGDPGEEAEFPVGPLATSGAHIEEIMNSPEVHADYEAHGVHLLVPMQSDPYGLLCSEPVATLDDLNGLKVRSSGGVWEEEIKALGMTPVNISLNESYQGLQQGIFDCFLGTPESIVDSGMDEVAKHYTTVPFSTTSMQNLVISKNAWDRLPKDAQKILYEASAGWAVGYFEGRLASHAALSEAGVKILTPGEDVVTTLRDHQEAHVGQMEQEAPEGIADPAAFMSDYRAMQSSWRSYLTDEQGIDSSGATVLDGSLDPADVPLDGFRERINQVYEQVAK
ncbi:C4-dicarboxylate TRAP transporter substrate-binding protein [Gordonia terrae]